MRILILLALLTPAVAQEPPKAHFHHIHLNTTDPAAAIDFYTRKFDCEKGNFAGQADAVWAQKSWMLFTKVKDAPPSDIVSAIWHFGWGAEDMPAIYKKDLCALQRVAAGDAHACSVDAFALADQGQCDMRQGRQVAACAHTALRWHVGGDAAVQHFAECIDDDRAHAGITFG